MENAIVYCQDAFNTPNGKTAHGLVRYTERYRILAVIDSRFRGMDALEVLDGIRGDIPLVQDLDEGLEYATTLGIRISEFIIGLAPDGGRLPEKVLPEIRRALRSGLNVTSGLHDFLSDNKELAELAAKYNCNLIDIRKPPGRDQLHFFSGKIEEVDCMKIAVLGTDSAVGKRTTAWILVHALRQAGLKAELIGTGQTAWLQGARYSLVMDSLVNDFVAGEIEHAIYEAWKSESPDVLVLEGQGSLMNPAYPGGFELLAAGRPDFVLLQHAPARREYDGFPGYTIHPLDHQIRAIEILAGKKVLAITVNHEGITAEEIPRVCDEITRETGLPAFDVLLNGGASLVDLIKLMLSK
jgi:uncharacterized NAD-dependent epimerase/dehydratase family protein